MKHVIKMFDKYYLRNHDDYIEEIYRLDCATVFNSKSEAKKVIGNISYEDHCKIVPYEKELEAFKKYFDSGMIRRTINKINKEYSRPYDEENDTISDVINFYIFNSENNEEVKYTHYRTWPRLYLLTKTFFEHQAFWDLSYKNIYHSFQIAINKKVSFEDFKKEFNLFKDYVTFKEEDYLIFRIFDHELSEYETRSLLFKNEEDCKITGRYSDIFSGTLEECFKVIQKDFYYDTE